MHFVRLNAANVYTGGYKLCYTKLLTFILVIHISVTVLGAPKSKAVKVKCDSLFSNPLAVTIVGKSKKVANQSTSELMPISSNFRSSIIVAPQPTTPQQKEYVFIRHGYLDNPPMDPISDFYFGSLAYGRNPTQEEIRLITYPNGYPFDMKPTSNRLHDQTLKNALTVGQQPSKQLPVNGNDDRRAAELYIKELYKETTFSEGSINQLINVILKDQDLLNEVRKKYSLIAKETGLKLTNYGSHRYFWFTPSGSSRPYPARVLDIHHIDEGSSDFYTFLIEYIPEGSSDGFRIRQIQQLNLQEFKTITENSGEKSRRDAEDIFFDSLSPEELQTLDLARRLKVKLYGYYDMFRGPGGKNQVHYTPLKVMNGSYYKAIGKTIRKYFGKLTDLLTNDEKAREEVNYSDVFGRLDAQYVMRRFVRNPTASKLDFTWVITEDGSLKILPTLEENNNLDSAALRLASGRKIFAGGTFTINDTGTININLNSKDYQQKYSGWSSDSRAFQDDNPNINFFVATVFAIQAGVEIANINAQSVDQFINLGDRNRSHRQHQTDDRQERADDSFYSNLGKQTKRSTQNKNETVTWDAKDGQPLNLKEYAKAMELSDYDISTKIEWAHYVLQTNTKMAWGDIKSKYRNFAKELHPDNPDNKNRKNADYLLKTVNEAYGILDQENRKHRESL